MSAPGNESEIDQQLRDLQEKASELIPQCRFASSSRLYGELRRRGRTEHRAQAYVMGTFFQMDQAQYLLDFQTMRERAVELIALLEDEEQLRQIQSDFPRDQYEYLVYSMSSCAYENLAEATGQLEGYNSEGMHACIADGIQICRRTGKTGCVSCFREYACDVYLAADDPDIAGHQCRLVMEQESGWSDRGDRRWLASTKLAWLEALQGRFDEALVTIDKALEFTDGDAVSLKFEGRIRTLLVRDSIRLAAGLEPLMSTDPAFADMPSAEECPVFENAMDLNTALQMVRDQKWDEASQLLTKWDQRLQKCNGTHLWFETRLRLIALKRLAGQQKQAEALAKQLEQRARTANDYLTLRRLEHLMDSDEPSPLAIAAPIRRNAKTRRSLGVQQRLTIFPVLRPHSQ
jgi:tetratricopeptide (TPR) repeat protein